MNALKKTVTLESGHALLQLNLSGGSYFDFHIKDLPVNPINFRSEDPSQPSFMGHFLCFDRWGPPTEAERKNGFHHHGEVNTQVWKMLTMPLKKNGVAECKMRCSLPMGGLELTRKIELSENEPVFFVKEEIKNLNKYGRMFNIVQHVTLAPPFLDKSTIFDNNTEKGFENKENGSLNQEEIILKWQDNNYKGKKISFRHFENEWPRVSSFVFHQNDKHAWVTACNPKEKLMLGYIWETKDYPWINFWRSMKNGNPAAFGIEFGTTGLHEPFPVIAKKSKIFDRIIYDFIDADEVICKSFIAFLAKIPEDYKGVEKITINNSYFIINEKNAISRDVKYSLL